MKGIIAITFIIKILNNEEFSECSQDKHLLIIPKTIHGMSLIGFKHVRLVVYLLKGKTPVAWNYEKYMKVEIQKYC